jgi:Ca2+-binding EF-hand superfamily protein
MRTLTRFLVFLAILGFVGVAFAQGPGMGGPPFGGMGGMGGPQMGMGGPYGGMGGPQMGMGGMGGPQMGMGGMGGMGGPFGGMGRGGRGGGMGGFGGGGGRSQFLEQMIRQFDTNGDGTITPDEVPEASKAMFQRFAQRAGLDATKPIQVTAFRDALANRGGQRGGGPGGGQMPGGSGDWGAGAPGGSSDGTPDAAKTPSLVPGFGVASSISPVAGFGVALASTSKSSESASSSTSSSVSTSSSSSSSAGSTSGSSGSTPAASPSSAQVDAKIRQYAESLMKQYDKNKDGKLDKDELSQMPTRWRDADRNGDGIVTLDEMTAKIMQYSGRGSSGSSKTADSSTAATDQPRRKSYKFSSPQDRLPAGLPSWFKSRDADGDGQVTMAEYSSDWNDVDAAKFTKYDLNGDGVITPDECLKAEKSK